MDKANHYIKLSEVEGILQNHVDGLFGGSCVEWSDDWGEGWLDDDDDDDEDEDFCLLFRPKCNSISPEINVRFGRNGIALRPKRMG